MKIKLSLGLLLLQAPLHADNELLHCVMHAVATPLLNYAATFAGQDIAQVSWKPSAAFGPQATCNKGFDFTYSSSSQFGNLAGLVLPAAHVMASYHMPQLIDSYILRNGNDRAALCNVVSFLLRNGDASFGKDGTLQLRCGVTAKSPQVRDFIQTFIAEGLVTLVP